MNKSFRIAIIWLGFVGCLGAANSLWAQNEVDALRFSSTSMVGTARSLALGGAFSAVGADLSAAHLNPGGLALYRSSSATLTPIYRINNNDASYLDQQGADVLNRLRFANLGVAIHTPLYQGYGDKVREVSRGIKSYTIAAGYNQLNSFDKSINISGFNDLSSFGDALVANANGVSPNGLDLLETMAFNAFVIDTLPGTNNEYFSAIEGGNAQQAIRIQEKGRMNEWFLSAAANVSDRVYVGATIGIVSVRYERELSFIETDVDQVHEFPVSYVTLGDIPFDNVTRLLDTFSVYDPLQVGWQDDVTMRGTGINAKLGLIVRPIDRLRMGFTVHTPSYINLNLTFDQTLSLEHDINERVLITDIDNATGAILNEQETTRTFSTSGQSSEFRGENEFTLITPFKLSFGMMYLLGKQGFLSADVDFIDYSSARLDVSENGVATTDFRLENDAINELLRSAINVRVGGEFRYDVMRFRAGAAYYGSALADAALQYQDFQDLSNILEINPEIISYSAGIGIRQPNFNIDVTWVYQQSEEKYNPYGNVDASFYAPALVNKRIINSIIFSLGFSI